MTHDTPTPPPTPPPAAPEGGEDPERLLELGLTSPGGSRTPPPSPEALAEQFPQFEILEVIGQGGMGVVYKARQRKLDRVVALKVLPRELGDDPAFAERFAREGRTLAKLQHPHIVGVHDFGQADGQWFLVMEYVDGVNLRTLMQAGELTPTEALAIVPQICEALQYAHDEGVVHRDIKPENVLLDRQGRVKVADFGLAKMVQRAPEDFTLTGTDQVMGTLHYMAPEQYRTPQDVDHRADIFSLGVVFYEMLTGELPVGRFAEPSKSKSLDARIDEIVMRALERERDERYQQARDVRTAVTSFREGSAPERPVDERVVPPPPPGAYEVQHARESASGRRTEDGAPQRRWSRWAVAGCIALALAPVFGGAAYALVQEHARFPNNIIYDDVAGWMTALGALGVAALLAIIAIFVTQAAHERVRGQWLAVGNLGLCLVGAVVCVIMLQQEVHRAMVQQRLHRELDMSGTIVPNRPVSALEERQHEITMVIEGSNHDEAIAIRNAIMETLDSFSVVADYYGTRVEDLVLRRLYDAEDLETLQGLSGDDDDERRAAGAYGLGMWQSTKALSYWTVYQLDMITVDESGDAALVRMRPSNAEAGLRSSVFRALPQAITFPMKRAPHGWVFAIGQVKVR